MKYPIGILIMLLSFSVNAQSKKNYFPIWTFHQRNINIHGISVGIGTLTNDIYRTNTNGLKVELIGAGILIPLAPSSPLSRNDSEYVSHQTKAYSEIINGIGLSASGTLCDCQINGFTAGTIAQIIRNVNGMSFAVFGNSAEYHRGIQLAVLANQSYQMKGLQIGLFNTSHLTKGIQLGLWNINEKRKMPIINWNFSKEKVSKQVK